MAAIFSEELFDAVSTQCLYLMSSNFLPNPEIKAAQEVNFILSIALVKAKFIYLMV